jgi:peptidoglycan/xylan/chitin deacetylase (PgdA/CDA1 family)
MKKTITSKLRHTLQSLKKRFIPVSLILMYHRVADIKTDPWRLSVSPQHFSEHLEVLQTMACSQRLDRLAHALQQGKIPRRSVVITFDDGYADNLTTAKPLLERFHIPATFFLSTGCIEGHREFWWDELERLILQPLILPDKLQLSIKGKLYEWDLDGDVTLNDDRMRENISWRAWEEAPGIRHEIYYLLWQLLKPLEDNERQHLLDQMLQWVGTQSLIRSTHSLLRPEEISLLAQGDMIEVGAHSATHVSLPSHSLSYQRDEINGSKRYLEELLGNPLTSFSYPYGDYTPETMALVKDAGFSCACSSHAGGVLLNSDHFQLPRLQVPDWDGEEFEKQLLTWFTEQCP